MISAPVVLSYRLTELADALPSARIGSAVTGGAVGTERCAGVTYWEVSPWQ